MFCDDQGKFLGSVIFFKKTQVFLDSIPIWNKDKFLCF